MKENSEDRDIVESNNMESEENNEMEEECHPVSTEKQVRDLLQDLFDAKKCEGKSNILENFESIYRSQTSTSDNLVGVFLKNFLSPTLTSESIDKNHFEKLRRLAESILFVNNGKFLRAVLSKIFQQQNGSLPECITAVEKETILLFLLETSHKLRNVPKFVVQILRSVENHPTDSLNLSNSFKELFADFALKMPVSQNMAIWSTSCEVLREEFSRFSENPDGPFARIHVVSEFMSLSLLNVKLTDYSIREDTIVQVIEFFASFNRDLNLLVQMAMKNPKVFIGPLLKVAFAYGELHQLLLLYNQPYAERNAGQSKVPEETNTSGSEMEPQLWNFSYFHGYADGSEWQKLAEYTADTNIELWAQLILQKIRFLLLFAGRSKSDKIVRNLIEFLVDHYSDCQTLWQNNLRYLLPYLSPKNIQRLGDEIVDSEAMRSVLLDSEVMERRGLQMAIVCAVFKKITEPTTRKRKADSDTVPSESSESNGQTDVLKILSQKPDQWILSFEGSAKEVSKWLRQAAEIIRQTMSKPLAVDTGVDESQLNDKPNSHLDDAKKLSNCVSIIDTLPLEYATGSLHSALLMGLVSLLVHRNRFQPGTVDTTLKNRIWMMIVRLLDNPEKFSSLYDYIPSAIFLNWAIEDISHLSSSEMIFTALLDEVLKSPQGLKDAAEWIESVDFRHRFALMVVVMEKVANQLDTVSNEAKKKLLSEMLDTLQRRFLENLDHCLNDSVMSVLKGSLCILKTMPQQCVSTQATKKSEPVSASVEEAVDETEERSADAETVTVAASVEEPSKVESLLRKLSQLVEVARKGLLSDDEAVGSSSALFLTFLLTHHKQLANHLPNGIRISVWDAYRRSRQPARWQDRLIQDLMANTRLKELTAMVNGILRDLQTVSRAIDPSWPVDDEHRIKTRTNPANDLRRVSNFFCHFMAVDLKNDANNGRSAVRLQAVQMALPLIQHIVLTQCQRKDVSQAVESVLPAMSMYLALLRAGKFHGYPQDIASPLHACLALPLDEHMDHGHFISIFTVIYKVIQYLLTKHEEIAADRIPPLLQAFRQLLVATAVRSDQRRKASKEEVAELAECANRLSRLASIINSQRIRYRRVATYVVAELMEQFQKRTLYPSVKHDLLTTLHHLLDMLDQHASRYLLAVLPAGVRELFRVEFEQFEKFYKFKGKV